MRHLFKSSFNSFIKSKATMIILGIVVFFSIATFTLLTSMSASFKHSYNNVVLNSNLHDFIAKEKYDLNGELKFKTGPEKQAEILAQDMSSDHFSADSKYIYFNTELEDVFRFEHQEGFLLWKKWKNKSVLLRLPFDKIQVIDTNHDFIIDKVITLNGTLPFELALKPKFNSSLHANAVNKIPAHDVDSNKIKSLFEETTSSWGLKKYNPTFITGHSLAQAKTINGWVKLNELILDSSLTGGDFLIKDKSMAKDWRVQSKVSFNKILDKIKDVFNAEHFFIKQTIKTVRINVDKDHSTGIYHALLNPKTNNIQGMDTKKAIDKYINSIGLNSPFMTNSQGKQLVNMAEEKLDSFIRKFAADQKRNDYELGIKSLYKDVLDIKYNRTINVSDKQNLFKVVDTVSNNENINKLHVFKGYSFPRIATLNEMKKTLDNKLKSKFNGVSRTKELDIPVPGIASLGLNMHTSKAVFDTTRKFKIVAHWNEVTRSKKGFMGSLAGLFSGSSGTDHNIPKNAKTTDPSSYFAYVSPGYYSKHHLKSINPNKILNNPSLLKDLDDDPNKVFRKFPKSTIAVGNNKYFVLGSAIQPDFAFPIINQSNLIPDSNSQAIIFTNSHGYLRTWDAYRNNKMENYFSFKFKDNGLYKHKSMRNSLGKIFPHGMSKKEIQTDIERISRQYMNWPQNIHIVNSAKDTNTTVLLAPQRVAFLEKLENSISTVSFLTSALLIVFVAFVTSLIVKRQISSKRRNLGILLANGYTKIKIAFSMLSLGLIIVVVPSILGYIVGHFLQYTFINMFADQWTLPITGNSFSWIVLLIIVVLPFLFISALTMLVALWEMRGKITSILSGAENKISGILSSIVLRSFRWLGIKNRMAISIFTSNLSKMLMVILIGVATISTLSISFTFIGKFGNARNISLAAQNYEFKIDLVSPTKEGGLLSRMNINDIGGDWSQPNDSIYKSIVNDSKAFSDKPHFHIPNKGDEFASENNIRYLENKIQTQFLLDIFVGSNGIGSIPWEMAKKTIPEGQVRISQKATIAFYQFGLTLAVNKKIVNEPWVIKDVSGKPKKGILYDKNKAGSQNGPVVSFRHFFANTMKHIIDNYESEKQYLPYMISYKDILINSNDETYTRIDAEYNVNTILGKNVLKDISIVGLKPKSKMVNLSNKNWKQLNDFHKTNIVPIIVNSYFEKIYGKSIGSIIKMKVTNTTDRFINSVNTSNIKKDIVFQIVGITKSYNGAKVYTKQEYANKALNYDKLLKVGENLNDQFNGVFSSEKNPLIFNSITLYSPSGVYVGTDTIAKGSKQGKIISTAIQNRTFVNKKIHNIDDFFRVYSKSPYVMIWSNPDWASMSDYAFNATLNLSSKIIYIIETIAIAIAVVFVAIISMMIIDDNKKFISTMKVLGYKDKEISRTFFKSFLPGILISLIIAIPLTFALLTTIQLVIMGFGAIYVPLFMVGWEFIAATVVVTFLLAFIYKLSAGKLKGNRALNAFKE